MSLTVAVGLSSRYWCVKLNEGPRLLTVIVDCDPDDVAVGARVVADYVSQTRDDAEVFAVPVFRLG